MATGERDGDGGMLSALPADRSRRSNGGPRIVVGIDYGTTNTGLAWLHITSVPPKESDVQVFRDWPNWKTTKVPSVISYSPSATHKQWGADIGDNSEIICWTKLELQPQQRACELERLLDTVHSLALTNELRSSADMGAGNKVNMHLGLGPADIVADFLKKVTRLWFETMQAERRAVLRNVPIDLVITHPGVSRTQFCFMGGKNSEDP